MIRSAEAKVASLDLDAVHESMIAALRLRSVLSSYGRLLRRKQVDQLRDELRWYATVLEQVRDGQEPQDRQRDGSLSPSASTGHSAAKERQLTEWEQTAVGQLHAAMDSVRYAELVGSLDSLVTEPPFRRRADRPASRVIPPLMNQAARQASKAAAAGARAKKLSQDQRRERARRLRKAAVRAQYAAELALPVAGDKARRLVHRMEALQDALTREERTGCGD